MNNQKAPQAISTHSTAGHRAHVFGVTRQLVNFRVGFVDDGFNGAVQRFGDQHQHHAADQQCQLEPGAGEKKRCRQQHDR